MKLKCLYVILEMLGYISKRSITCPLQGKRGANSSSSFCEFMSLHVNNATI